MANSRPPFSREWLRGHHEQLSETLSKSKKKKKMGGWGDISVIKLLSSMLGSPGFTPK